MQKIFIGDVQGCAREFREILAQAQSRCGTDLEIWQVGDLVNKGPENLAALEIMRKEVDEGRGHFVLGNHELHLIRVLAGIDPLFPGDTLQDVQASSQATEWLSWLRAQPLAADFSLGDTPGLLVHAAVHPLWTLGQCLERARAIEAVLSSSREDDWVSLVAPASDGVAPNRARLRDDLGRLTTCRSVDSGDPDHWSPKPPNGSATAWHAPWRLARHDYGIVYGHWAQQGLVVAPGLRGLDTGCVYGQGRGADPPGCNCLTAWLPDCNAVGMREERSAFDCPDDSFWTAAPEHPYLSGSEPYTYQPEPTRKGVDVRHASSRGLRSVRAEAEIVVVSGLPRSGTSMWMQMLRRGGVPVLADDTRPADEDNPRGYLEWQPVKRLRENDAWLDEARGCAVKVVAPLLPNLPARHDYAVLFSQRDIVEVVASQRLMLRRLGREDEAGSDDAAIDLLAREVDRVLGWIENAPNVRALFLDYVEVIRDPFASAVWVSDFLGARGDPAAMAREVDGDLYRQRRAPSG